MTPSGDEYRPADAPDRDEIIRIMHLYTDSWGKGDPSLFKEAFRDDAWMLFLEADGTPVKRRIWDEIDRWATMETGVTSGVTCRIISLIQAGDIANVLLGFDTDGPDDWVDLHNLIRIDGVWKITNKTAVHRSRAGGA
jgi:hypothetical protein